MDIRKHKIEPIRVEIITSVYEGKYPEFYNGARFTVKYATKWLYYLKLKKDSFSYFPVHKCECKVVKE